MTLTVLPAYRRNKIGSFLVNWIVKLAQEEALDGVFLHVWVSNVEAQEFYAKLGFICYEKVENYYKDITPSDGVLLGKLFQT